MKVTDYLEISKFKSGDIVWACAFESTYGTDKLLFKQEPILGMVVSRKTLREIKSTNSYATIRYFIPFKKNAKFYTLENLAWSKAVNIHSRKYATTEAECIELYNELIDDQILYHQERIYEIEKYHI